MTRRRIAATLALAAVLPGVGSVVVSWTEQTETVRAARALDELHTGEATRAAAQGEAALERLSELGLADAPYLTSRAFQGTSDAVWSAWVRHTATPAGVGGTEWLWWPGYSAAYRARADRARASAGRVVVALIAADVARAAEAGCGTPAPRVPTTLERLASVAPAGPDLDDLGDRYQQLLGNVTAAAVAVCEGDTPPGP